MQLYNTVDLLLALLVADDATQDLLFFHFIFDRPIRYTFILFNIHSESH